ncbi:MAG: GxxExxY protein [Desulfobacterales bacterium]|nr:GxxExxY protein [Desulfobacterales bacterium]
MIRQILSEGFKEGLLDRMNRIDWIFSRVPEEPAKVAIAWRRRDNPMEKEDLTHKVIGCAYQVYNTLGFGFLESVYRKAMVVELEAGGIRTEQESPLRVAYRDQIVGDFFVDLLVEGELIVELKSLERLGKVHETQLVNYLVATGNEIGLLINFGPSGVEVKRKYRTRNTESKGEH